MTQDKDARIAELAAENERLKIEIGECKLVIEQQDRDAEALSRTGAVKERREDVAKLVYEAMSWAAMCGPAQNGTVPVWVDRGNSLGQEEARRTADRILSTLEPAAPEGRQEAVAYGEDIGGKIVSVRLDKSRHCTIPLYTRPSEQTVTDAMVEAACEAFGLHERKHGLNHRQAGMREALKSAMEAGRHE